MNTDADTTILHLGLMQRLAERLAGDHFAIYEHTYNQIAFGSWEVVIGTHHKRRRFIWDGKDSLLSVSEAEFTNSSSPPSWRNVREAQCLDDSQDEVCSGLMYKDTLIGALFT